MSLTFQQKILEHADAFHEMGLDPNRDNRRELKRRIRSLGIQRTKVVHKINQMTRGRGAHHGKMVAEANRLSSRIDVATCELRLLSQAG